MTKRHIHYLDFVCFKNRPGTSSTFRRHAQLQKNIQSLCIIFIVRSSTVEKPKQYFNKNKQMHAYYFVLLLVEQRWWSTIPTAVGGAMLPVKANEFYYQFFYYIYFRLDWKIVVTYLGISWNWNNYYANLLKKTGIYKITVLNSELTYSQ